jgi:ADP-ribosyl-[dinitrogen reductase] hydrolase
MAIASSAEQRSRALGACYGLLVGDALGAPYEFRTRGNYEISSDYVICETFGHVNFPLGGWTDDSSMALCLLESLLENDGKWNAQDCVKRWMRWMDEGTRCSSCFRMIFLKELSRIHVVRGRVL